MGRRAGKKRKEKVGRRERGIDGERKWKGGMEGRKDREEEGWRGGRMERRRDGRM